MKFKERIRTLRDTLLQGLIERETPMRLALLAALAGEHLLLIGPPGTAKSELARRLRLAFHDAAYFERLLTRFSVPEELFGPLSIKALEEDRYQRQTAGYLPTASIAFIDEIFKANSAILNSLLTLLNEREFDNGTQRSRTPLICVLGASNELPEVDELGALYDRFLLRYQVPAVSDDGFPKLLALRGEGRTAPALDLRLSVQDLADLRQDAAQVEVPAEVIDLLKALRAFAAEQQIAISDRRWRKIVSLLQVAAYSDGRTVVSPWDGWLLQFCVCDDPTDAPLVLDWYRDRIGASSAANPERLTKLVKSWQKKLEDERTSQSQRRDKDGKLLYRDMNGKETTSTEGIWPKKNENNEQLYLLPDGWRARDNNGRGYTLNELRSATFSAPHGYREQFSAGDLNEHIKNPKNWLATKSPNPPLNEPTRYSKAHIDGRLRSVDEAAKQVTEHLANVDKQLATLKDTVDNHLWISPGFSNPAGAKLTEHRDLVRNLDKDIKALRQGFEKLPLLPEEP